MTTTTDYTWDAFISYSHKDSQWAEWMQDKLESFDPSVLNIDRKMKAFRDQTDLGLGYLKEQIDRELSRSHFLILLCSPNSAASTYVNDEVTTFIRLGHPERIIPFIIEGEPHSKDTAHECFPPALLNHQTDLLGANINEISPDYAAIKVIARMFDHRPDELWKRHLRAEEEEHKRLIEERNRLLAVQSRYLSEKANGLRAMGNSYLARLIALYALPGNLEAPDRPYTREADQALRRAISENSAIFYGHNASTTACAFSPDDSILASADAEGSILLWNAANGQLIHTLYASHSAVKTLNFSPDGKTLITLSADDYIRLWDTDSGQLKHFFTNEYKKRIQSIAIHPHDNTLVLSTRLSGMTLFGTQDGTQIRHISILNEFGKLIQATALCYSGDGKRLFVFCDDKQLRIYDTSTYNIIGTFPNSTRRVSQIAANHDGSLLAIEGDAVISIHGGEDFHSIKNLIGHRHRLQSVEFSSDGSLLMTSSHNDTKIWSTTTWEALDTLWNIKLSPVSNSYASFSHDGKRIALTLNKGIKILDTLHKEKESLRFTDIVQPYGHDGNISFFTLSNNGRLLLTLGHNPKGIMWTIGNEATSYLYTLGNYSNSTTPSCAAFAPDDKTLAIADKKGVVRLLDPQTGHEKDIFLLDNKISSLVVSHNGKRLASVLSNGNIIINTLNDHTAGMRFNAHQECVLALAFSHDDRYIASIDRQTLFLWDSTTGQQLYSEPTRVHLYTGVVLSPDADRMLVLYNNHSAALYDTSNVHHPTLLCTQNDVGEPAALCAGNNYALSISTRNQLNLWDLEGRRNKECPMRFYSKNTFINDRYLLSYDASVRHLCVYDLRAKTPQRIGSIRLIRSGISIAIPSPTDDLLAVANHATGIQMFDTTTGTSLWTLPLSNFQHPRPDVDIHIFFSPDGQWLIYCPDRKREIFYFYNARTGEKRTPSPTSNLLDLGFPVPRSNHREAVCPVHHQIATLVGDEQNTVLIKDQTTGENITLLRGHKKKINSIDYSPDGSRIVTTSADKTIRLWDIKSNRFPVILTLTDEEFTNARFTADGQHIVSSSTTGRITLWDATRLQDIIDSTRQRFADRPLTELERQRYYLD